jgi:hypothetical protein
MRAPLLMLHRIWQLAAANAKVRDLMQADSESASRERASGSSAPDKQNVARGATARIADFGDEPSVLRIGPRFPATRKGVTK